MTTATTDATEAALLRGVMAAPEDDLPRLVFADYLEENGGDRERKHAAVIRAMIDAPAGDPYFVDNGSHSNFDYLFGRPGKGHFEFETVAELVLGYVKVPPQPVRTVVFDKADSPDRWRLPPAVTWHRGFLSQVTLPESSFFGHEHRLSTHPLLGVTLTDKGPRRRPSSNYPDRVFFQRSKRTDPYLPEWVLVANLFELLPRFGDGCLGVAATDTCSDGGHDLVYYENERTARAALRSACLTYIRSPRA